MTSVYLEGADALDRAADMLDRHGHCKNVLKDVNGSLCFLGAVNLALYGSATACDGYACPVYLAINEALVNAVGATPDDGWPQHSPEFYKNHPEYLGAMWNNAPERTAAEVKSTMRAVAATLRAQHGTIEHAQAYEPA